MNTNSLFPLETRFPLLPLPPLLAQLRLVAPGTGRVRADEATELDDEISDPPLPLILLPAAVANELLEDGGLM
jgi:hypothetical protein